ncbi:MAG: cyclic nucleotide-binding domain-containing protein [Rhizobiaceae bacterium]|nr:cyclic nucleotide-binding domain-containing protein [Rhizobiaceae bacterium]
MALNDDLSVLRDTPLFSQLPVDALRLVAFGGDHRNLIKGDTLYRQGDAANCAYVVASGEVEIFWTLGEREPVSQGVLGRGGLMGEVALIAPSERQFTIKAVETSELIRIDRDVFHRLMSEYPQIAEMLRERIQQNLGELAVKLSELGSKFR